MASSSSSSSSSVNPVLIDDGDVKIPDAEPVDSVMGLDGSNDGDKTLRVKLDSGTIIEINVKAAMMSEVLKVAYVNGHKDGSMEPIPVPHIEDDIMEKIKEYLEHYKDVKPKDIVKPLPDEHYHKHISEFDAEFILGEDVDQDTMFKLVLAANFLDIQPLLRLACGRVASMMKNKSPDQIRTTFHLRKELTQEEKERVQKEYSQLLD